MSEGTRTPDRLDHNQELYQLSYAHRASRRIGQAGAGRQGRVITPRAGYMRIVVTSEIVPVLQEDPDLGRGLEGPRLAAARRDCRAEVIAVRAGAWDAAAHADGIEHGFGLLLLDGVVVRRVGRQRRHGAELLGPGDLIRPTPTEGGDSLNTPFTTTWRVMEPLRAAVLDHGFVQRAAPYPELAACLTARAVARARHVLVHMAIAHHARVDKRLELLLWHLADRWGRVTPHGVALPLRLTHELLADLVAAQRPSVTLSLQHLERDGRLARRDGVMYLLGDPPGDGEHDDEDEDDSREQALARAG
ncbi:MAG: family transcriptional regulator, cyclic receptor protein [Solirubrobacteraceae bacterium]|nr:family transcriptional regulator, cyclic receptor protein [Solirubrobacteraceae bacterium]